MDWNIVIRVVHESGLPAGRVRSRFLEIAGSFRAFTAGLFGLGRVMGLVGRVHAPMDNSEQNSGTLRMLDPLNMIWCKRDPQKPFCGLRDAQSGTLILKISRAVRLGVIPTNTLKERKKDCSFHSFVEWIPSDRLLSTLARLISCQR